MLKVSSPEAVSRVIELASVPEIAYVTTASKGSVADTVPMVVWFSSALSTSEVEKTGPSGSTSIIST